MTPPIYSAVSDSTVTDTWGQARTAAVRDPDLLRGRALQAGPRQADRLFPRHTRTPPPGQVNARSGDILRTWYVQVYSTTLTAGLGERSVTVPAAAEIGATATALRQVLGSRYPHSALRLVATVHRDAALNATRTVDRLHSTLTESAPARAAGHLAQQPTMDSTRGAILEHWYQRCYREAVDGRLGLLPPLHAVTRAEVSQVAAALTAGQPRRVIGADGTPLVNVHGTAMTDTDRRLAAGDSHVVDPPQLKVTNVLLRRQVTTSWNSPVATDSGRVPHHVTWAQAAGIPDTVVGLSWHQVPGEHQSRLIAAWLDAHRDQPQPQLAFAAESPDYPFRPESLTGPPRAAAAAMFNHHPPDAGVIAVRQAAGAMYPAQTATTRTGQPYPALDRPAPQPTVTHHLER